jgi:hypothetical protein
MMMMAMVAMVLALLLLCSVGDGGGFILEAQAARVAPWSLKKAEEQQGGVAEKAAEARHDPLPLPQQEKLMALQADMDSANRELMAIDPYYFHW